MKLHLHHLDHVPIERNNVADPFRAVDGRAILRHEVAASGMVLCDRPEEADLFGLPAHWHAYPRPVQRELRRFFDDARALGRRVLIWVNGDDEIDFDAPNLLVFQHAVRRSRKRPHEVRIYPAFVEDPLVALYGGAVAPRSWQARPVVGFCGQGAPVLADEAKRLLRKAGARAIKWLGRTDAVPEPWPSHVRLRNRVLQTLASDDRVKTNFIIRDQYRAGLQSISDRRDLLHPTSVEFFDNIRSSDFTACVRGGGNFSVRLFETLCLGRMPLLIDSDGILPWPEHDFWRLTATVPSDHLNGVVQQLVRLHQSLDTEAFHNLQREARDFWNSRLSLPGYFSHFAEACVSRPPRA